MVVENVLEKESAIADLRDLTPCKAAKGALTFEDFQNLPGPLPDPSLAYGELLKEVKVCTYNCALFMPTDL